MDMTDPRLQLSDLTDYQFQTSLAHQYNPYNTTSQGANQAAGYFQNIPHDDPRPSTLNNSQPANSRIPPQPQDFDLQALYQRASIPNASREFVAGSRGNSLANLAANSNGLHIRNRNGPLSTAVATSNTPSSGVPLSNKSEEVKDPTTFVPPHLLAPMKPNPPSLKQWREKFFNIDEPLSLTSEEYLTYFPHVDNVYSHRSTQKYKRKPFVSHYWDCRLKGRPTGTPMNKNKKNDAVGVDKEPKKRKRKVRERDLCDVKIKVTEYFGAEELEALRKMGLGPETNNSNDHDTADLTFVLDSHQNRGDMSDPTFGVLEPMQNYPPGHPGAGGKKWYLVQRVNGNDKDGDEAEDRDLDHKHTLEESDRIKKNSVQRWLLAQAKEKKKAAKADSQALPVDDDSETGSRTATIANDPPPSRLHASGSALQTVSSHLEPTNNHLTLYACSYCPFSQRVWIALELMGIPYQYVEVTEGDMTVSSTNASGMRNTHPELQDVNPEGKIPCLKHNNFAVWDSGIMMEYLEDLAIGSSLFVPAMGSAQLKAHSRLWVDFIDRRVLPAFYALLLLPDMDYVGGQIDSNVRVGQAQDNNANRVGPESSHYTYMPSQNQCDISTLPQSVVAPDYRNSQAAAKAQSLIATLHNTITTLVNASHRTGPFFLGPTLSYVDVAFAPWIIRLSRVLSYYRGFPRPEVGTRWRAWCDAIENNDVVRRTVSKEENYRQVYGAGISSNQGWQYDGQGRVDWDDARTRHIAFPEMKYARRVAQTDGLVSGGDIWGKITGV